MQTPPNTFAKAFYLIETKEQMIAERDYMEANWKDEFYSRMRSIGVMCLQKFGVSLSNLA